MEKCDHFGHRWHYAKELDYEVSETEHKFVCDRCGAVKFLKEKEINK